MSVNFIKSGPKIFIEKLPDGVRSNELKPALYSIECSREEGFYLTEISDKYVLPKKTYGNHDKAAQRVIRTHLEKKGNTGILLTGLKGTGKSLFAKAIANELIERKIPVIQINKPYSGEEIFNFIESIGNCGILFDEFGKNYSVYNTDRVPSQSSLLGLFDGMSNSKRIHLFTENTVELISDLLLNRPGRVHYHFKYNRLSEQVIEELCRDSGLPEELIVEMKELSSRLKVLSFDIIKCLIDEWKLYGGSLTEHIDILNVTLCKDPANKEVIIISIVKQDGTPVKTDGLIVHKEHDRITISSKQDSNRMFGDSSFSEYLHMNDVVKIEKDLHYYTTASGLNIILKIKE